MGQALEQKKESEGKGFGGDGGDAGKRKGSQNGPEVIS